MDIKYDGTDLHVTVDNVKLVTIPCKLSARLRLLEDGKAVVGFTGHSGNKVCKILNS